MLTNPLFIIFLFGILAVLWMKFGPRGTVEAKAHPDAGPAVPQSRKDREIEKKKQEYNSHGERSTPKPDARSQEDAEPAADGESAGAFGSEAAPEPERESSSGPLSLFEKEKKEDLARPLMERLGNSLMEQDKEDDLTRPLNYGSDIRNTTDLFELDKRDDLTKEW